MATVFLLCMMFKCIFYSIYRWKIFWKMRHIHQMLNNSFTTYNSHVHLISSDTIFSNCYCIAFPVKNIMIERYFCNPKALHNQICMTCSFFGFYWDQVFHLSLFKSCSYIQWTSIHVKVYYWSYLSYLYIVNKQEFIW